MSAFHIGLALLAGTLLAAELVLMRLFKIAQGSEFTQIAISLALLGFGASGTLLALARRPAGRHARALCAVCAPLAGLTLLGAFALGQHLDFRPEFLVWGGRHTGALVLWTLPLAAPFLLGGIALGAVFVRWRRQARGLYAANLIGSGLGAGGLWWLLWVLAPEDCLLLLASLAAFAGAMMAWPSRRSLALACALLGVAGCVALDRMGMPEIRLSDTRDLWRLRQLPGARTVRTALSPHGRVDVIESPAFHWSPGQSLTVPPPEMWQQAVCIDGQLSGDLVELVDDSVETQRELVQLVRGLRATPWTRLHPEDRLGDHSPPASLLWCGPLSEIDIMRLVGPDWGGLFAFRFTFAHADPHVREIFLERRDVSGLGHSAALEPFWDTLPAARRRLLGSAVQWHLFDVSGLQALRAAVLTPDLIVEVSGGRSSLDHDTFRTREAMALAMSAVSSSGGLILAGPMDHPPRSSLRLLVLTALAAAEESGTHAGRHLIGARGFSQIAVGLFREPVTPRHVDQLRRAREFAFDLVWVPGIRPEEINQFNLLDRDVYHEAAQAIFEGRGEEFIRDYPFDLRPPAEWWPFFWQPFRPATVWAMVFGARPQGLEAIPEANALLALILSLWALLAAAASLMLAPLLLTSRRIATCHAMALAHFACLGLGYLTLEVLAIFLVERVVGDAVLAATLTLATFLVASGIGSLTARSARRLFVMILVTALATVGLLELLAHTAPRWPSMIRGTACVATLTPLATLMGRPFPLALRRTHAPAVPWAWGVNGFASVLAPTVSLLLALTCGYQAVLAAGLLAYAAAWALARTLECPARFGEGAIHSPARRPHG